MWFGYVPQIKNTNVISARGFLLFSFPSQLALSHILRKPDPPNSLHPRLLPSTIIPCQPNRVFPFSKTYIYISSFPRVFHICICVSLYTVLIYTHRRIHTCRRHLINFYFRARKEGSTKGSSRGGRGEEEEVKVGVRKEGGRNVLEREGAYVLSSCR